MNILLSLLLIVLIVLTTGTHIYFVWKRNHYKMLFAQLGIISLTIILGLLVIYDLSDPSISKLLNMLSPLQK
jgi:branched-subunit amino acid transport protein AzlD